MATEYAWLIEKKDRDGRPMWAAFNEGFVNWEYDANKACRFCRREDAEQMADSESCDSVTQHGFDDGTFDAAWAVNLIRQLAPRNDDASYREAVIEIISSVR